MKAIINKLNWSFILLMFYLIGCTEKNPEIMESIFFGDSDYSLLAPEVPIYLFPLNNAYDVPTNPLLRWSCFDQDSEKLTYDLYFSTEPDPPWIDTGLDSAHYQLQGLAYETVYYWGVVARDESDNYTLGPVWSFMTGAEPNSQPAFPTNPLPIDSATKVSIDAQLSWTCSDPDFDPLRYDLYFGTSTNPPLLDSNIQVSTYNPGRLQSQTDYYWYVIAKDDHGNSTSSEKWMFQTTLEGKIAFVSNRDSSFSLYQMDVDGTNQELLLNTGVNIYNIAWSPDGSKLAYTSYVDSSFEIFIVNFNGTDIRRLTNNGASDGYPSWSPDGSRLTFTRDMGSYNDQIFVINIDGTGETNLSNNTHNDHWSTWSPDGTTIAFIRSSDIWIMNTNGSNQIKLVESYSNSFSEITWSPDGSKMLTFFGPNYGHDIYVIVFSQNNSLTKLTTNTADDLWPSWSPDGDFIVWNSTRDGNNEIYIMRADGSDKKNISNKPNSSEIQPSWKR